MKLKITAEVEIDDELTGDDIPLYVDAAMTNPEFPWKVKRCEIIPLEGRDENR